MNDKEMNFNHIKYFIYNTPKFNNYSFSYKAYLLDIGKRMIDEAWIACYIYKDPIKMEKCLMECVDFIRYIGEYIKNPDKDKETNETSDAEFHNDQKITSIEEGLEK